MVAIINEEPISRYCARAMLDIEYRLERSEKEKAFGSFEPLSRIMEEMFFVIEGVVATDESA